MYDGCAGLTSGALRREGRRTPAGPPKAEAEHAGRVVARYQHVTDTIRDGVARQVDSLIWQARDTATGEDIVPVSRSSLTAILRLAELGLVHADQAVMADAQRAIEQIRTVLASRGLAVAPRSRSWIEASR